MKTTSKKKKKQEYIEAPYPHFRKYYKSGHPALLLSDDANDKRKVVYRRTSHEHSFGGAYDTVFPNPKPGDSAPMYLERKKRVDYKKSFSYKPYKWKYDEKNFIKNKKR